MSPRIRQFLQGAALILVLAAPLARAAQPPAPFRSDQLVAELTRAVSGHFEADGDLQLELLRPWTPPARSASAWQVIVTEFPAIESSTLMVRCKILADGAVVAEPTLMLRAALWRDVWYSREPLTARERFSTASLEARRTDCLRARDALPASVGDANLMFARDVPPDRVLTWHDIARRPLVRKGEVVEVVASEGRLFLSMKALSLQAGARGDLITVRNLESLKDISGQVIDEHRVEVRF